MTGCEKSWFLVSSWETVMDELVDVCREEGVDPTDILVIYRYNIIELGRLIAKAEERTR